MCCQSEHCHYSSKCIVKHFCIASLMYFYCTEAIFKVSWAGFLHQSSGLSMGGLYLPYKGSWKRHRGPVCMNCTPASQKDVGHRGRQGLLSSKFLKQTQVPGDESVHTVLNPLWERGRLLPLSKPTTCCVALSSVCTGQGAGQTTESTLSKDWVTFRGRLCNLTTISWTPGWLIMCPVFSTWAYCCWCSHQVEGLLPGPMVSTS